MLDALETIVDHWPLFLFVFCAVPLILSAALVVWIMRRVTRMTSPSVERIQGQYAKLSAKQPADTDPSIRGGRHPDTFTVIGRESKGHAWMGQGQTADQCGNALQLGTLGF